MIEIIKYTFPALIVAATVFIILNYQFKQQAAKNKFEILLNNRKTIITQRLQAYERLILFLERISPDALIMRTQRPEITVIDLQRMLLKTIRTEFDHNLSQQLYVSNEAWERIRNARENTVKLINSAAQEHDPKKPAMHLSKTILEGSAGTLSPTKKAIDFLKNEIQELFRY